LRYIFDGYVLDATRRELRRGGATVASAPQVFDLLEYLIRHRVRVVGQEELIGEIWGGRAISESALTTRVSVTRHLIGDSGAAQRLIRTVPRKGFRFIGEVHEERSVDESASEASADVSACSLAAPEQPSMAVLPFADKSGDPFGDLLADGLAEDVLVTLAKLRWLTVAARNASRDPQPAADAGQIGRELGVRYVLEGSVRRLEGRIRITCRLIDVPAGIHVWADRYDRDAGAVFAAHDDIAAEIVAGVAITILRAERRRAMRKLPGSLDAWEAYQRGMWHMCKGEPSENALAQDFFRRAIDLDPNFAPGQGALAWSYMMAASIFSQMTIAEGCELAAPMLRKAVLLDENDLESRARFAIMALLQGDLEGACAGAEQVLAVNQRCAEALGVKGAALIYSGRGPEGRVAVEQHLALSPIDPARPIRLSQIASSLYLDGNYRDAATAARRVVRQYPKHPIAYRWLAASLGHLGQGAEAEEVLNRLRTTAPSSFEMYVDQRPQYCGIEHAPMLAGLRKAGWRE
jgi:adenylate cyclase